MSKNYRMKIWISTARQELVCELKQGEYILDCLSDRKWKKKKTIFWTMFSFSYTRTLHTTKIMDSRNDLIYLYVFMKCYDDKKVLCIFEWFSVNKAIYRFVLQEHSIKQLTRQARFIKPAVMNARYTRINCSLRIKGFTHDSRSTRHNWSNL